MEEQFASSGNHSQFAIAYALLEIAEHLKRLADGVDQIISIEVEAGEKMPADYREYDNEPAM